MGPLDRHGALYKSLRGIAHVFFRLRRLEAMEASAPSSAEGSQFNRFSMVS